MKIAIVGAGRIGTTFGYFLARGGHDVTLVARGARLEELQRSPVIETVDGSRAPVTVSPTLDATTPWDLVLVTVLGHQVGGLLPELGRCAAKTVLFMFNTFDSLQPLRDAVGASRFAAAFPVVIARFENGKLQATVSGPGNVTTLSSAEWAAIFQKAGLPSTVEPDMQAWLRGHVAWVMPLMALGCTVLARGTAPTWSEATRHARAMQEALAVVRTLGHPLLPGMVATLGWLPRVVLAALTWVVGRTRAIRDLGVMGPGEPRALIDAVCAAAPGETETLRSIRPA